MEGNRVRGYVKWFNASKGYGFIAPEEGGSDVFVHYSGINASGFKKLNENDHVEFVVEKVQKGFQATDVTVISPAEEQQATA